MLADDGGGAGTTGTGAGAVPRGFAWTLPPGVLSGAVVTAAAGAVSRNWLPTRSADGLSIPFQSASSR